MKKWALTAVAVVCLACADDGVDPGVPADDTPGIVTSLTLRWDTIPTGGGTEMRIALHNVSDERIVIPLPDGDRYGIQVSDTVDTVAWMPCGGDSVPGQLALDPGGIRVAILIFETYARPGICFAPSVDTLHAGTYTVRAGIHGYEDTYPWARATLVVTE